MASRLGSVEGQVERCSRIPETLYHPNSDFIHVLLYLQCESPLDHNYTFVPLSPVCRGRALQYPFA